MDTAVSPPSKHFLVSRFGLVLSVVLLFHATLATAIFFHYQWRVPDFLPSYLIYSVIVLFLVCCYYLHNFLFLIRMTFLGCMGVVPMSALYFGGFFSFRGMFSQTEEIAFMMLLMSNMALMSAHFGFLLSKRVRLPKFNQVNNHSLVQVLLVFFVTVFVSYLIGEMRGGFVFGAGYGAVERGGEDMPINNLNVIARMGIYFLFFYYCVAKHKGSRYEALYFKLIVFSSFYLIVWNEFFRGARMDPLTEIVALMVLVRVYSTEKFNFSVRYILLFLFLFMIVQAWGYLRTAMASGVDVERLMAALALDSKTSSSGAVVLFFQGTLNNLYVTISTTMYAVQQGIIEHWYGQSYVDFFLRTPPAFIYPDRPDSLAWLPIKLFGKGASGGGFTEIAEVFLNFGVLGALVVPGIISFGLGFFLKLYVNNKYSLVCAIPIFSFLAVYFRGNLYQTFVFYKALITGIILFVLLNAFSQLLTGRKAWGN